jgi:hypothetical protein
MQFFKQNNIMTTFNGALTKVLVILTNTRQYNDYPQSGVLAESLVILENTRVS